MYQLDVRRLLCPMPVIRVQQKIETLTTGDRIEAICTDPGVLHDIPAWAKVHGHKTIDSREQDGEYIVIVEVGAEDA
ncbi:MAG TPA: sulfurtransferase TusA family protein [Leucothrix mucor]|uniref:Sulfurtransferase TusA family protein n=1 Tax=Leucothrix mucor TaxID=45248 RepID=A0A7V2SYL5_LEUMU|nr:sulfurtransferase TusA family protein [Leucothrix mucor]